MKWEKTMKRIKNFIAIGAFALLVLSLPAIASAQSRDRDWDDDDDRYGNNGRYDDRDGRNGRYGGYDNYGDTRSIVRSLKSKARELQRHLDRDLDNSRYDGSRREDQLNDLAHRFRNEVNGLSESNKSNNRRRDNRVDRVLNLGQQLDRALSRTRVDGHIRQLWSDIRYDLDALDRQYGYYDNNNRNRNRRNNGYGNYPNNYPGNTNRNGLPSWWPF